jgi:hypothetical protein
MHLFHLLMDTQSKSMVVLVVLEVCHRMVEPLYFLHLHMSMDMEEVEVEEH